MKKMIYIVLALSVTACSAPQGQENQSEQTPSEVISDSVVSQVVVPVSEVIECYGILDLPPGAVHEVYCKADGYISGIQVQAGSEVRQGQVLATVTSPDFSVWHQEFIAAKIQWEGQQKHYDRSRKLFEEKAISDKDFEQVEKSFLLAKSQYFGIRNRLVFIGFSESDLEGSAPLGLMLKSPATGVLTFAEAVNGQKISAASHLFTVIHPHAHQLKMYVAAQDMDYIQLKQSFLFLHHSDTVNGHISLINSRVENDNTVVVYGKLDNYKGQKWIAGQRVFVQILR
jgi:membrane fusion protein, heavy metal efflux system